MYVKAVWKHLDKVGVCCARSMYNVKSSWQSWQNKLSVNIRSLSCPCSKDSDKEGWTWNVSIKLRNWCVLAWNDENQKFTNAHVCQYGKRRKRERLCFSKPEQTKPAKQSSEARQGAELSGRGGTWSMERRRIREAPFNLLTPPFGHCPNSIYTPPTHSNGHSGALFSGPIWATLSNHHFLLLLTFISILKIQNSSHCTLTDCTNTRPRLLIIKYSSNWNCPGDTLGCTKPGTDLLAIEVQRFPYSGKRATNLILV